MTVRAEFYQNGPSYVWENGALVADGLPRFEAGKFAGTRAVRIEEGTTNLLTANQSNVETDGTGFTAIGAAAGVRDTAQKFEGAASYKVTFNATASSGTQVSVTTSTQATYAARFRLKGDATSYPASSLNYHLRINYSDASLDETIATITPNVTWQDILVPSVASNTGKIVASIMLMVRQAGTNLNGRIVWIDALQIEEQTESTTWHVGGGMRSRAQILVPTAEIFNPSAGTVEAWIWLDSTVETRLVFDTRHLGNGLSSTGCCFLRIIPATGAHFSYWNGSTLRVLSTTGPILPLVWLHVAASWGSTGGKLYQDGTLFSSHPDPPVLTAPSRLFIGGRGDGLETGNGLRIGGMRFTRGRVRTDAEILAAVTSGVQFVQDGAETRVFSFDGTMRSLLPSMRYQIVSEAAFLRPIAVTASTSATNYPASNMQDWEFPLLSHRTTNVTTQATLTFDYGAVVNVRSVFIALTNWEWCRIYSSYDGVTYTEVVQSPISCAVDPADQYRKVGAVLSTSGRYMRIVIPAQVADENAAYFETPLVIFTSEVDAFAANPHWGTQLSIEHDYESTNAGGHDEVQARGRQYLTMQVRGEPQRGHDNEWMRLAGQGNHRKFLLFVNMGKAEESYLMRPDGSAQWEEQVGVTAFSLTWREHIN